MNSWRRVAAHQVLEIQNAQQQSEVLKQLETIVPAISVSLAERNFPHGKSLVALDPELGAVAEPRVFLFFGLAVSLTCTVLFACSIFLAGLLLLICFELVAEGRSWEGCKVPLDVFIHVECIQGVLRHHVSMESRGLF